MRKIQEGSSDKPADSLRLPGRLLRLLLDLSPAALGAAVLISPQAFGKEGEGMMALLFFPEIFVMIAAFTALQVRRGAAWKAALPLVLVFLSPSVLLFAGAGAPWLIPFFVLRAGQAVWTGLRLGGNETEPAFVLQLMGGCAWIAAILAGAFTESLWPAPTRLLRTFASGVVVYYLLQVLLDIYAGSMTAFARRHASLFGIKAKAKQGER